MDSLKNCDVRSFSPAHQKKNVHSFKRMGRVYITKSSGISQDGTQTSHLTFTEDFMMEHSNLGRSIALLGIASSKRSAPKKLQPSAQSFGFPS